MLRGYRGVIVAVAGLSLITMAMGIGAYFGALYSPHKKQYQAVSSGHTSATEYRGPSQSLADISGIPGPAERAIANPQPTSGEDHEKRDLAAQESMSVWAFWMMLVAAFSAIVTTIGTVFLYKQIRLTREAVEDTGRATGLMEAQNTLAEQTAQRQLRAYIGFVEIKAKRFRGGMTPTFSVKIKNAGQSPALRVRCLARLFMEMNATPHDVKVRFGETSDQSVVNILPGQSPDVEWQLPRPLEAEVYNAIVDGSIAMVYAGVVEYWDIFGKRHISTFKNFINREQMGTKDSLTLSACSKGNYSN